MKRTKNRYCSSTQCPSVRESRQPAHEFLGKGYPQEGFTVAQYKVRCTECGYESWEPIPRVRCHKRVWPYYNESTGVTFESESHEQKYVKANNLTPA